MKYFFFYKFQDNSNKRKKNSNGEFELSPYEETIKCLSHEDKILQKNLKILLNGCENLESLEFSVRNKNNYFDILNIID